MGVSKTQAFTNTQNNLANIAKGFAHPARIAIISYLLKEKTCICRDIVQELPLSQATVSQHLTALKKAGLIVGTIEGNTICYCLNKQRIKTLVNFLHTVFQTNTNKYCC